MKWLLVGVLLLWAGCGKVPTPVEPEIEETPGVTGEPAQSQQTTPSVQNEPFNITATGIDDLPFASWQKRAIRNAIQKWEAIIVEGVPDTTNWLGQIDDIQIHFDYWMDEQVNPHGYFASTDSYLKRIAEPGFPYYGRVNIYAKLLMSPEYNTPSYWELLIAHEIAHVLGFSQTMLERVGVETTPETRYFTGPKACEAYRGFLYHTKGEGLAYAIPNLRIPLMPESWNSHWQYPALEWDVMSPYIDPRAVITLVTIQAFADMGYIVDLSQAERPSSYLTKPAVGPRFICDGKHIFVKTGDAP